MFALLVMSWEISECMEQSRSWGVALISTTAIVAILADEKPKSSQTEIQYQYYYFFYYFFF